MITEGRKLVAALVLTAVLVGWTPDTMLYAETITVPPITRSHPRLYVDEAAIAVMRQRVADEVQPWYGAWLRVKKQADGTLDPQQKPKPLSGRVMQNSFFIDCVTDSRQTVYLALAWHITGEAVYAERGLAYLLAWAEAEPNPCTGFDPTVRFPNMGMEVARAGSQFVWAYDLLYNYEGFAAEQKAAVEKWLRIMEQEIKAGIARWQDHYRWDTEAEAWVRDPSVPAYFGAQDFQNHIAGHTMGLTIIGYALGDRELVQYALDSEAYPRNFKRLIAGCIFMHGENPFANEPGDAVPPRTGEIYDRYRHYEGTPGKGIGYTHLTLSLLVATAEMAYNNGLDFYHYTAPTGENLELPFDFYADLYRLKDSTLKGGFYSGEDKWFNNTWLANVCEIAHKRYPRNEAVVKYLRTMDRSQVHPAEFLGISVLTHGEPLE